jgi:hypothetical protein
MEPNRYYARITSDVSRRLAVHNSGAPRVREATFRLIGKLTSQVSVSLFRARGPEPVQT